MVHVIVSNEPLTYDSEITATEGGVSPSFTALTSPFVPGDGEYQVWNSVSCLDGYLYALSSTNVAGKSGRAAVKLNRADLIGLTDDLNGDGKFDLADIRVLLQALASGTAPAFRADYNGDGAFTLVDVLYQLRAFLHVL